MEAVLGKKSIEEELKDLDALVFDIQDVGVRFYTYISTLQNVMEEAAKAGPVVEEEIDLVIPPACGRRRCWQARRSRQAANIERLLGRPITILGHARQYFHGNWKLYAENSRDSYHGGLLHLFYPTFGIYRQGQRGWVHLSDNKLHQLLQVCKPADDQSIEHYQQASARKADAQAQLEAPEMLRWMPEFDGEVALTIHSMFPNVVLQQISNTLAVRQIQTKGIDATELVWTFYGFADDSPELTAHRLKQHNMVGPAGYISMEDGEAVNICQQGIAGSLDETSVIECGGDSVDSMEVMGVDENGVRGFWKGYRRLMGL